jgi:hypothetical protein
MNYWTTRRRLLNEGLWFRGDVGVVMSHIDVALDLFNADPDRIPDQIDEAQLRIELESAIDELMRLGAIR